MCGCFYRDRVEGPQSIIKSQRQRVLGSDCSKNFTGRRKKKNKTKVTFKNRARKRETVRDDRGVMQDEVVGDILN